MNDDTLVATPELCYAPANRLSAPPMDRKRNDRSVQKPKAHAGRPFRGKRLKTSLPRPEPSSLPAPAPKGAERVAKVIARAGLGSRRQAEEWIAAGRVAVNGEVIASPAVNVRASDAITLDGKPLPQRERTRLFLYHKPVGRVTTTADPQGRPTIFEALPKSLPRLISVGRLDLTSEGLLLLTNDGGLARVLELPETGWLRRYRVRAHGQATQAQLDALRGGVEIDGVRYGPIEATLDRVQGANVWITFAMREGKNREIRNVLGHLGLKVNRLIRISYGPFQLGDLAEGEVMEIRTRALREQLGERIAQLAGADFSAPIVERAPVIERAPIIERAPAREAERSPRGVRSEERKQEGDKRAPRRTGSGHVWRARAEAPASSNDAPVKRKPARGRRQEEPEQREPPGKARAGLLVDRKGRRVLVQRIAKAAEEQPAPKPPRGRAPRGKAMHGKPPRGPRKPSRR